MIEGHLKRTRSQPQQWFHQTITRHISPVNSKETVLKDYMYFWLALVGVQLDIEAECVSTNGGDTVKCHTNRGPQAVAILANKQWCNMIALLRIWQTDRSVQSRWWDHLSIGPDKGRNLIKPSTQVNKVRTSQKATDKHKSWKIKRDNLCDKSDSLWMVWTAPRWGSEMRETRKELQNGGLKKPADSLGSLRKQKKMLDLYIWRTVSARLCLRGIQRPSDLTRLIVSQ